MWVGGLWLGERQGLKGLISNFEGHLQFVDLIPSHHRND